MVGVSSDGSTTRSTEEEVLVLILNFYIRSSFVIRVKSIKADLFFEPSLRHIKGSNSIISVSEYGSGRMILMRIYA